MDRRDQRLIHRVRPGAIARRQIRVGPRQGRIAAFVERQAVAVVAQLAPRRQQGRSPGQAQAAGLGLEHPAEREVAPGGFAKGGKGLACNLAIDRKTIVARGGPGMFGDQRIVGHDDPGAGQGRIDGQILLRAALDHAAAKAVADGPVHRQVGRAHVETAHPAQGRLHHRHAMRLAEARRPGPGGGLGFGPHGGEVGG